jgi:hypothetical protein
MLFHDQLALQLFHDQWHYHRQVDEKSLQMLFHDQLAPHHQLH